MLSLAHPPFATHPIAFLRIDDLQFPFLRKTGNSVFENWRLADVGCRNTVFGAEAQEASRHLAAWREAGISRFRIEFAHESRSQVERVTRAFEDALAGRCTAREVAGRLQKLSPHGITEGSLFVPEGYQTLPILQ